MTQPGHPIAAAQLLARACSDAIEHDAHTIQLHASPNNALHEVFCSAGGGLHQHEIRRGISMFVRLEEPMKLLEAFGPLLVSRAVSSEVRLPAELGVVIGKEKMLLNLTNDKLTIQADRIGRSYIRCESATWTRLLLGYDDAHHATEAGRLEASTAIAGDLAQTLFPSRFHWRPPWDDQPA